MIKENQKLPWWVYIVECTDSSYYIGITNNIDKRVNLHNSGKGAKYTRSRGPVKMVYSEKYPNRSLALQREIELKKLSHLQKQQVVLHSR